MRLIFPVRVLRVFGLPGQRPDHHESKSNVLYPGDTAVPENTEAFAIDRAR